MLACQCCTIPLNNICDIWKKNEITSKLGGMEEEKQETFLIDSN